MIKSVEVINYLGDPPLVLELTDPWKTGLYVKSITGIGPGKASINVTDLASDDGGIFNSARAETRNIVLTLGMLDGFIDGVYQSIETSRQKTYRYFAKKRWLTLILHTDNRDLYIEGYVESNEPDIFSKDETTQISIICPDPKWYKAGPRDWSTFGGIENLFEFPYSNEGIPAIADLDKITVDDQVIEGNVTMFGRIVEIENVVINYQGEVETGVEMYIHFDTSAAGLEVFNVDTGERLGIDDAKVAAVVGSGIQSNDEITICTIHGKKSAILTRDGVSYNIINALGRNPAWFQLYQGDNTFTFNASAGREGITFIMYYTLAFEGV